MAYVRLGQRGRLGRLAGANRVSRMGRLRGLGILRLGQFDVSSIPDNTVISDPNIYDLPGENTPIGIEQTPLSNPSEFPSISAILAPSGASSSSSGVPGGLTTADANVISAAITAAGKVGTQAIVGTPTLTYNPLTGQYTATGGATIPSSLGLTTAITSYLPLILLAGGAILLFSAMGKR